MTSSKQPDRIAAVSRHVALSAATAAVTVPLVWLGLLALHATYGPDDLVWASSSVRLEIGGKRITQVLLGAPWLGAVLVVLLLIRGAARSIERNGPFNATSIARVRWLGRAMFSCAALPVLEGFTDLTFDLRHMLLPALSGLFLVFFAWVLDRGRELEHEHSLTV